MVKVITERPARPIPQGDSIPGVDDGDDGVDWTPDTTSVIPPGIDPGDVLTWDGDSWEPEPPSPVTGDFELNIEGGQSVIHAHGTAGATETIDPTLGNVHTLTLDQDCTITLDAPVGTGAATLVGWVTEDGTGGWDITWPGTVTEDGTHDTAAGTTQRVVLETVDGGGSWLATWTGGSSGEPTADAHIADTADAHDASAVSIVDTGGYFTGTDVEAALQEIGAAGGGGITVKDEGTPLATAATALDFVGAGVTASGAGATKTITISGGGGSGSSGPGDKVFSYQTWR
jgi:hypothetical protein